MCFLIVRARLLIIARIQFRVINTEPRIDLVINSYGNYPLGIKYIIFFYNFLYIKIFFALRAAKN